MHLRQAVSIRISHVCTARYAAHLFIFKGLDDVTHGKGIEKTVRIDKDEKFLFRQLCPDGHGFALAHVLWLLIPADAVFRAKELVRFLEFCNRILDPVEGMVIGAIVDDDDFQFIRRIILIDCT